MSLARFGVQKPVPVNLLMFSFIIAGVVCGLSLRREFFPETDPEQAAVSLSYPGATPEEIEQSLAIKVEDKLADLDEVDELHTTLSEGGGEINVVFREGADVEIAMDEIDRAIDSLTDLPDGAETIQVQLFEVKLPVIRLALYGQRDERVLKRAIRSVRDDLRMLPGMGEIVIQGSRDYELRVDVQHEKLVALGLSLPQVADVIGQQMDDTPGGTVRGRHGNVRVRAMGVQPDILAIEQIVLLADAQGQVIRVRDVARVSDALIDEQIMTRFDGLPASVLTVYKVGKQDIVKIAEMVRAYVMGRKNEPMHMSQLQRKFDKHRFDAWLLGKNAVHPLPTGVQVATMSDLARFVEGRLDLLLRNAGYGSILVFLTLFIFLNWRAALWVGMGLVTAITGTLVLMYVLGITLNLLTMFGLIVVLGLLVDDAIVVAENIQSRYDRGETAIEAAVHGAQRVFWPVTATVLTSVVAFLPLTFIKGRIGDLLGALPVVVACALLMSLIESLLILPSHMGHSLSKRDRKKSGKYTQLIRRGEAKRDRWIMGTMIPWYSRCLGRLLHYRYISIACAIAVLMVTGGMVKGGHVVFTFLSHSDSETIIVDMRMPIGTPIDQTNQVVQQIEQAARKIPEVRHISSVVGQSSNVDTGQTDAFAPHVSQMFIELVAVEQRDRESSVIINQIRQNLKGKLDPIDRITFSEISGGPDGADITLQVQGQNPDRLRQAVAEIKTALAGFQGVHDISDNNDQGQLELRVLPNASARALGLSREEIARQLRGLIYGIDAHVFSQRQEDIDVRVRMDATSRRSLFAVQNIWITTPQGKSVPLGEIATIQDSSSYATLKRIDRRRAVTVIASTAPGVSPESIVSKLTQELIEDTHDHVSGPRSRLKPIDVIRQRYPDLTIQFAGRQKQLGDAFASLPIGFGAAMIMIYVILAWLFGDYTLPLAVMLVIPFSAIGVVWGHWLLGYDLTFLSMIGFVALSGIVVNDSLIFVEFFTVERTAGKNVYDSLIAAGQARIRAIILTTLTTVLGLTPLILERSFQAKFLIPMAISIAMGLLCATAVVLVVLPCTLMVYDDLQRIAYFLWHGKGRLVGDQAENAILISSAPQGGTDGPRPDA